MPVRGGKGGANTSSGLHFEKKTKLREALKGSGFHLEGDLVLLSGKPVGQICSGEKLFYKLVDDRSGYAPGSARKLLSKLLRPDEAFLNLANNTVYVVEKKFQERAGSVDEKPQSVRFKQRQYQKLVSDSGLSIDYFFLFNCLWAQPEYRDMLEFVVDEGSSYFFNDIPLAALGLGDSKTQHDPDFCSEHSKPIAQCAANWARKKRPTRG